MKNFLENGEYWIDKDIDKAYLAFCIDYKFNNTYKSSHNLGTFLSKYGKECLFCPLNKNKLINKLLCETVRQCPNFYSYAELGDFYFNLKKYEKSEREYKKALEFKNDIEVLANLSISLYFQEKYEEAIQIIKMIINNTAFDEETSVMLYLTLGFSYVLIGEEDNGNNIFKYLTVNMNINPNPDIFNFAFLLKKFDYIAQNYNRLFDEWIYSIEMIQVIYGAFLSISEKKAKDFIIEVKKKIHSFMEDNPSFCFDFKYDELDDIISKKPQNKFSPDIVWRVNFMS